MFAFRFEKFLQSDSDGIHCGEDLWRRSPTNFFPERHQFLRSCRARKIKTGLSVGKVNALNFSSTALFTGGVNWMKFINFHASIILELNSGRRRRASAAAAAVVPT